MLRCQCHSGALVFIVEAIYEAPQTESAVLFCTALKAATDHVPTTGECITLRTFLGMVSIEVQ